MPHHEGIRIEEAMSTDLFTIHPDEPVDLVTHLMDWKHVRHVPVEDEGGRLVGLVSLFDVIAHLNRAHSGTETPVPVRSVMNPRPTVVQPRTSLLEGISLMKKEESDCLLVVQDERLVGIVTERDIRNLAADLLTSGTRHAAEKSNEP